MDTRCLEFSHTALIIHALYIIVINNFGSPSFLRDSPSTLKLSILFSGLINTGVQVNTWVIMSNSSLRLAYKGFFGYRIKIISKSWIVPILCWIILVIRLTCVIASSVIVLGIPISTFAIKFRWLLTVLLVSTAVGDLVVAAALAYFLANSRSGMLR